MERGIEMSDYNMIELPRKGLQLAKRRAALESFANQLVEIGDKIGFPISARGWGYELEGTEGSGISKDDIDRVEYYVNICRKENFLPIDFVAEEGRQFSGVEIPESTSPIGYMRRFLSGALSCGNFYTPDWWDDEEYYIQMVVEKIDLKTMFEPICREYHIPIATASGWSSILMRGTFARRFKEAEERGLKSVLLYYGDHDPPGILISDFLRSNLKDLENTHWDDGTEGYDPGSGLLEGDLIIDRFGLKPDFIKKNKLTWIDNLITSNKKNLASPKHPHHYLPYVQDYIKKFGVRKCEANAILKEKVAGRQLCVDAIEKYLGEDALDRFQAKQDAIVKVMQDFRERTGLDKSVNEALNLIDNEMTKGAG